MTGTQAPASVPPRPLAIRLAKAITALVAFVGSLLAIVFLLWPSLKPEAPSPTRSVALSGLELERPVTLGAYLKRIHQPSGGLEDAVLNERDALASFDFVIEGYKNRALPLTWQLIDARGGTVLDENGDIRLKPEVTWDSGTWRAWGAAAEARAPAGVHSGRALRAARRDRAQDPPHSHVPHQLSREIGTLRTDVPRAV